MIVLSTVWVVVELLGYLGVYWLISGGAQVGLWTAFPPTVWKTEKMGEKMKKDFLRALIRLTFARTDFGLVTVERPDVSKVSELAAD